MACALFNAASCKKKDNIDDPTNSGGTVRPVGQPVGEVYTEIIGPSGGVVKSEDGRVEIDIPAGALAEDTEIGIQPLKNTAVNGIGYGYRLTPHGRSFSKKVTVRFHYKNDERRLSSKEAIEIAYQNEIGEWICPGGTSNDPVQKTLSVQTDHFSDWALVESMNLSPVVKTLRYNETATFKAWRYTFPVTDDDFLVPLAAAANAKNGEPAPMDKLFIVRWTLNGPGKLEAKGSEAVYTAPPSAQGADKTATITLELNVYGKQVLLISTVYIVGEGIDISIDGGPWQTYAGMASKMDMGKYTLGNLRVSSDLPQIVFIWPGNGPKADGIYSWSMLGAEESSVVFEYAVPDLSHVYVATYEDGQDIYDSGGFLSVEETTEGGKKFLTGIFAIDQAGYVSSSTGKQQKISSIVGTYKVLRNW